MKSSFSQRHGVHAKSAPINDFPLAARNALLFILERFVDEGFVRTKQDSGAWRNIYIELLRTNRSSFQTVAALIEPNDCYKILISMRWDLVYAFCERFYEQLLVEKSHYESFQQEWILETSIESIRNTFTQEMNNLLSEEGIAFTFEEGEFIRSGRPQTQKNIARAQAVLVDPALQPVKTHFLKAHSFFNEKSPDLENVVKEAICALEAAIEIKSGKKVSKDFARELPKLATDLATGIPSPIIQMMVKLQSYRGSGTGVAHGNTDGYRIGNVEAEMVLSVSAALISYVVDHYNGLEPDVPF